MLQWEYAIDVHKEWQQALDGVITPKDFAGIMATKLKGLPDTAKDNALEDLILSLETVSEDPDEVDFYMDELWDWADLDHRLWIWTMRPPRGQS